MLKAKFSALAAMLLVVATSILGQSASAGDVNAALLEELKNGGYVLYMRHPHTDKSQKDTDKKNLAECKTQRNLNEKGKNVAKEIGAAVKALKVSFNTVKTSEYCRARQVPALMGIEKFEKIGALNHSGSLKKEDADKRAAELKAMFSSKPAEKGNTLLIGHSPNIKDADIDLIAEGFDPADMIVLQPKADKSGYKMVARITPAQWSAWAKKDKKQ